MKSHRLVKSLLFTSRALKRWNRNSFGFAQHAIAKLEVELKEVQSTTITDHCRQTEIIKELKIHRERLESINK